MGKSPWLWGGSLGSRVPVIWLVEGKLSFFLVSFVCWKQEQVGEVSVGFFGLIKVDEKFGETLLCGI